MGGLLAVASRQNHILIMTETACQASQSGQAGRLRSATCPVLSLDVLASDYVFLHRLFTGEFTASLLLQLGQPGRRNRCRVGPTDGVWQL